jgi:hypothetical protein
MAAPTQTTLQFRAAANPTINGNSGGNSSSCPRIMRSVSHPSACLSHCAPLPLRTLLALSIGSSCQVDAMTYPQLRKIHFAVRTSCVLAAASRYIVRGIRHVFRISDRERVPVCGREREPAPCLARLPAGFCPLVPPLPRHPAARQPIQRLDSSYRGRPESHPTHPRIGRVRLPYFPSTRSVYIIPALLPDRFPFASHPFGPLNFYLLTQHVHCHRLRKSCWRRGSEANHSTYLDVRGSR